MFIRGSVLLTLVILLLIAPLAEARDPVLRALGRSVRQKQLPAHQAKKYRKIYLRSRRSLPRLPQGKRQEMAGVIANTRSLARHKGFVARSRPIFYILDENYRWFVSERRNPGSYGQRREVDDLVVQAYPGQGWQLQPLANFTTLQAKIDGQASEEELERRADALRQLAISRGGIPSWEYYFAWDGGRPGWASAMATAIGARALVKIAQESGRSDLRDLARRSLALLDRRPPSGVEMPQRGRSSEYLLYSQRPDVFVGNAMAATVLALFHYNQSYPEDKRAKRLFIRGLRRLARTAPYYDTGFWSLYSRGSERPESDLAYHRLFGQLLRSLCLRTSEARICRTGRRFLVYEQAPVRLRQVGIWRGKRRLLLRYWVSKRSSARLSLWRRERLLRFWNIPSGHGGHQFILSFPYRAADRAKIEITSLTGAKTIAEFRLRRGRGKVSSNLSLATPGEKQRLAQVRRILARQQQSRLQIIESRRRKLIARQRFLSHHLPGLGASGLSDGRFR